MRIKSYFMRKFFNHWYLLVFFSLIITGFQSAASESPDAPMVFEVRQPDYELSPLTANSSTLD